MRHPIIAASGLLAVLCLAPATLAGLEREAAVQASVNVDEQDGKITRVAPDGTSFVLEVDGRTVTLTVNENTVYTLNDQPSSRERALVVGHTATVSHEGTLALRVAAQSPE